MARLIVEQGGKRRSFRLNEGKLTIGSGEAATLTLGSEQLAEVHAELELRGGEAVLRLRPGVTPAVVQGRRRGSEIRLRHGVRVQLGDVELSVELEQAPTATPASGPPVTGARGRTAGRGRASVVQLRETRADRFRETRSMPSWLIVLLLLAGAGGVYLAMTKYSKDAREEGFAPHASQVTIEKKLAGAEFVGVLLELERVDEHRAELSPEWIELFEGFRRQALAMQAEAIEAGHNIDGEPVWQTQLKRFMDERLRTPNRPAARVFLQRIADFRRRWPTHSKLGWCDRMEARYRDLADLSSPPTWEDVAFEVDTLTWAMPKDYVKAFRILERFVEGADAADRDKALTLMDEKVSEREEYFDDRLQQARYYYERNEPGKAVEWLVQIVIKIGDERMANDAARRITQMAGVERALRGYRNDRPETFSSLMENAILHDFAVEKGVL